MPLSVDLLHSVLFFPESCFQLFLLIGQLLNLLVQLFQRIDLMLFQENDHLRFCVDVVSLSPDLITFSFAGAELRFNVDQSLDLTFCEIAPRNSRNVHMITSQRPAQRCFIVFRAEGIKTNIPFTLRRLDADLRAALDATADIFQQLHQRIEAVRLHPQRGINDHSQLIPMGKTSLIALPLIVGNGLILRILND